MSQPNALEEPEPTSRDLPRVAIVAEHASLRFGGEAALPFHFFRVLRARGVDAYLVVHERCRDAVLDAFPADLDRLVFVPDRPIHRVLMRWGKRLPSRIRLMTTDAISGAITQRMLRREVARLIRSGRVDLVHQPIPVSPRAPSTIGGLGVPVVMGPLNGGMDFPPAFRGYDGAVLRLVYGLGRRLSGFGHLLADGKLRADALLVANPRTARALPKGIRGEVIELVENGVDPGLWDVESDRSEVSGSGPTRFVFLGRLVDWKAVDLLIEALGRVVMLFPARLEIIGDGAMRGSLEDQARRLWLTGRGGDDPVAFSGWLPQSECSKRLAEADALVLPSLYECGGAVVLEAMAAGRPVIATDWGGPADYLDPSCGILVPPESREGLIAGLANAMIQLAVDPELRRRMGAAGRRKALELYSWDRKAEAILAIYRRVLWRSKGNPSAEGALGSAADGASPGFGRGGVEAGDNP